MKPLEFHRLVLGVDANATADQLRQAYIDLVKRWHPDRFAHDRGLQEAAEAKLKEINEAYKELRAHLGLSADTATVHPQPKTPNTHKDEHEQASASASKPPRPHSSKSRANSEGSKRGRSLRIFSLRLLAVGLALLSLVLAIAAIIRHVDIDRLAGSTGASANQPEEPAMTAPPAKEITSQQRTEFIEKMKNSYESTLKTLVEDEEEKGRLQVEYTRRRELFSRNMISREELAATEKDLAKATAKIAEDKQLLTKTEMAIAAATVAQDRAKQPENEN